MAARASKTLLALVVGLMLAVASSAYAAPADDTAAATSACGTGASAKAVSYLPVSRWADATTSFHSRLDADTWNDLAEKVQRNGTDTMYMTAGNAAWGLGTDALYASSSFCPINVLGHPLDSLVGTVGKALDKAGVFTLLVVVTSVSAVMGLRKGHDMAHVVKEVAKTGAVMGVLTSMLLGAAASTKDTPGTGSPWWWVDQANTIVNSVSGTVAKSAVDSSSDLMGYQPLSSEEASESDWPVTCTTVGENQGYIAYLRGRYDSSYTKDGSAEARGAALPAMVSSMWEASVLPVWAGAQFGTENPYTDHVFCFFLEARSQSTSTRKTELQSYLRENLGIETEEETSAWRGKTRALITYGGPGEDQSLIGWAACIPKGTTEGTVRGDWSKIERKPKAKECETWWGGGSLYDTNLDWDDGDDTVNDGVKADGVDTSGIFNYIATVHGKDGTKLGSIMVVYFIGSLVNAGILLLLAVLQFGAKLLMAFMVVGLFAALARSLTPGDDGTLFKRTGLQLVGASFVASCAGLMIAIIMLVAGAVTKVGAETFAPGTAGAIIATCTGPAIGTYLLHWVFTSVLRVPSPFTVKGAMSWGKGITTGVIGGAVGGAVTSMGANAREAASSRRRGHGGSRTRPSKPDTSRSDRGGRGRNRTVFGSRSGAESLERGITKNTRGKDAPDTEGTPKDSTDSEPGSRQPLLERATTEEDQRKQKKQDKRDKVRKEAKRLADNDGRLGETEAWRGYTRKARSNLRRARNQELRDRFTSAVPAAVSRGRDRYHQATAKVSRGMSAAGTVASWAAHHPARAAAAAGTAGWRGAATGARATAAGAQVLRRMPAKKAVAAGAGAALAVGAPTAAAGVLAAGAGAALARSAATSLHASRNQAALPAQETPQDSPGPSSQDAQTEVLNLGAQPAERFEEPQETAAPEHPAQAAADAPTGTRTQPSAPEPPAQARAAAAARAVQAQAQADTMARRSLERARTGAVQAQKGTGPSASKVV